MRTILACTLTALFIGAVAWAQSAGNMASIKPEQTQHGQRDCIFPSGGWTTVNADTSTAAASGNLTVNTRYLLQCSEDAYVSFSGTTADSSDGYMPKGTMLPFMTTLEERAYSVLHVSVDGVCRHIVCK